MPVRHTRLDLVNQPALQSVMAGRTILLLFALVASTRTAWGQGTPSSVSQTAVDPRLTPWLGCWRTIGDSPDGSPTRACVTPSRAVAGTVDLVLYSADTVVSRQPIPRPGLAASREIDGCRGNETAEWTSDDARLILRAELRCAGGVRRVETGLLTMTTSGEWLQLQHLAVGENEATTAVRFRLEEPPAGGVTGFPGSAEAIRLAVGAPVSPLQVLEVARRVPTGLTEAWVAELGQGFTLDGKALVKLADRGMPAPVIDLMVALSHPEVFALRPHDPLGRRGASAEAITSMAPPASGTVSRRPRCADFDDFCYGPAGMGAWGLGWRFGYGPWDPWDPWAYRYGYGVPVSPFGAIGSPFGYGYGNGWGGTYWGRQPIVIVNRPSGGVSDDGRSDAPTRGRAVNGGGYTRSGGASSGGSSVRSGGSSGGSSGSSSGGSTSGSGSSGGTRTAKPRGGSAPER
jgi:hypothetical protein